MITLNGRQSIAGCDVWYDDVDRLLHYAMPAGPAIALDPDGRPILSLVWYRRDVAQLTEEERRTRLGGGILTLSTELRVRDEQEAEIRTTLAGQPRLAGLLQRSYGGDKAKLAQALKLGPVPIKGGTVTIAVLGEDATTTGEFVATLVGAGQVSMVGPQRASFMAKLTQDGAVLLWEMLERELAAIRVGYTLTFDHRLEGIRMVVWANARKSFEAIQEQWQNLHDQAWFSDKTSGNWRQLQFGREQSFDAGETLEIVTSSSQASGVVITPETAIDPTHLMELERAGHAMIEKFLADTFLQWNPGEDFKPDTQPTLETQLADFSDGRKYGKHDISHYTRKEWNQEMDADLRHSFTSKAVLEAQMAPNDNLANILAGHPVEDFRTQIELDADWYQYLDVQVLCTADFANDPVDLVKVHMSYDEQGSQGRVHEVKDFAFQKDSGPQQFLTFLADPTKKTYAYSYEVFYRGTSATYTGTGKTDETILVLDTDRLGILHVDVELGLVDWTQLRGVLVKLWYGAGTTRKEAEFLLKDGDAARRWTEVIGRSIDDEYHYQVTFIDANNQRITAEPQSGRSARLIIDQPLGDALEVAVVPAGAFGAGGLSKVVVALRYRDDDNDYAIDDSFILSGSGQSELWRVPLVDKDLRRYEYQVTVFYDDGVIREEEWQPSENPVLAVGDPYGFRVQISPYLLKNPPYAFGTVHLTFKDEEARIHAEKTLEITTFTEPQYWRFRLGSPDRHTYCYQLTLFTVDGEEITLPEEEASREVLVLKPPAA